MMATALQAPLASRLWAYQAERFPVLKHGLAIAAFASAAAALPASHYGAGGAVRPAAMAVAAAASFLFFLQLRVADEHKDFEADRQFRPERPVPRGLVRLDELRWIAIGGAIVQAALAAALHPALLAPLALVWGWMALMTVEFLAPTQLKARPFVYMVSHMAVMPLIALFGVACGSIGRPSEAPHAATGAFLALAFVAGAAMEIARKCKGPQDEKLGVETYSQLWGPRTAATTAAVAVTAGAFLSAFVNLAASLPAWSGVVSALAALPAIAAAAAFARAPSRTPARWLEHAVGAWVLVSYASLAAGAVIASGAAS